MPTYDYECANEECLYEFETIQRFSEEKLITCPECNQDSLRRVISGGLQVIDSSPKTVGSLAEKNRKKFGKEYCDKKAEENKTKRKEAFSAIPGGTPVEKLKGPAPFWRPNTTGPDMSLSKMDNRQRERYIKHGKRS